MPDESKHKPVEAESDLTTPMEAADEDDADTQLIDNGSMIDLEGSGELVFPKDELVKLDEMINRQRWVVPVLPKAELETLLIASIALINQGQEEGCMELQSFIKDGLVLSFTKILTDDAVNSWKLEIQKYILENCKLLIDLCCLKMKSDNTHLLDLLYMALNPHSKFHQYNMNRPSESINQPSNNQRLYAFTNDQRARSPIRGWLVDLMNRFGRQGGFQSLKERFLECPSAGQPLTVTLILLLIRPFGYCYEVLTAETVKEFFLPISEVVTQFLDKLTDEELKKESKSESLKNDSISSIIKSLKHIMTQLPGYEEDVRDLEMFRLKMILRLLKISSFNGKMNALNEVNKVIASLNFYGQRLGTSTSSTMLDNDDVSLTTEKMADWISKNKVLDIVLRDSLHQPQYVEKLEKILRFMIKERALTTSDLDRIWEAQSGKHDAIVKNIHELLAKLAWDFSPEQLDHLFKCFQDSWTSANKQQREKLLELIRRLAEDDKEGVMAHKVLGLLWSLAHKDDCPTDIMDQALAALIKILDYSCSAEREQHKLEWIDRFVQELSNDRWVIPALRQIMEVCKLFSEQPTSYNSAPRTSNITYRSEVINNLQTNHSIVMTVAKNLVQYIGKAREFHKINSTIPAEEYVPDGRFNHIQQVEERLVFLRFLLKDGQLWLCSPQAVQVWDCLTTQAVWSCDRDLCFKWFTRLMGDEPDLDPDIMPSFFSSQILKLDPALLTEDGFNCYERFFRSVNGKDEKLLPRKKRLVMNNVNLVGMDYIWRMILHSNDDVSSQAIHLLKDLHANLGPNLQPEQVKLHRDFISECFERLRTLFDTVKCLDKHSDKLTECTKMIRVLSLLHEFIGECDEIYTEERVILPLNRAARGTPLTLIVRIPSHQNRHEDIEIWTHTNDTISAVKRQVLEKGKLNSNYKIELFLNQEPLDSMNDFRLICQLGIRDKTLMTAKLLPMSSLAHRGSASESSSESSPTESPGPEYNDQPNPEAEKCLPGVILASDEKYIPFLLQISDHANKQDPHLEELESSIRWLLHLVPAHQDTVKYIKKACTQKLMGSSNSPGNNLRLESQLFGSASAKSTLSPSRALYILEVLYSLLMPASQYTYNNNQLETSYDNCILLRDFIQNGGVQLVMCCITRSNDFITGAQQHTQRDAMLLVMRITHVVFLVVAQCIILDVYNRLQRKENIPTDEHHRAVLVQQDMNNIGSLKNDHMLIKLRDKVAEQLTTKGTSVMPTEPYVLAVRRMCWCAASGDDKLEEDNFDKLQQAIQKMDVSLEEEEGSVSVQLSVVCYQVMSLSLILQAELINSIPKDRSWQRFVTDTLLECKNRLIRNTAKDQYILLLTRNRDKIRSWFITLLFTLESSRVVERADQSQQFFYLLCALMKACPPEHPLAVREGRINTEIKWLYKLRDNVKSGANVHVNEVLLEGHLNILRELICSLNSQLKYIYGSHKESQHFLCKSLLEDFILPASRILCQERSGDLPDITQIHSQPISSTPITVNAAYDVIAALCCQCAPNLKVVSTILTELFYYSDTNVLNEWEYLSPVGSRPPNGFVGLKNGGATCYMNSVIQQLFMMPGIRQGVLSLEGAATDIDESDVQIDMTSFSSPPSYGNLYGPSNCTDKIEETDNQLQVANTNTNTNNTETEKSYHLGVLKRVQMIFAHLAYSKLQYYIPKGFWKHFKIQGEQVNVREQHDALEFFERLVESCDEAMAALEQPKLCTEILCGLYADQKICKDCPHRYMNDQAFTTLHLEIRGQSNLQESLEQFVKGDLLEGDNAYMCEKCQKKVDIVKRMCVKKLPNVLAIQLKRFDYDYERECPIKFNDYFEFPRELDMEPYTVYGLAKMEGEKIVDEEELKYESQGTHYQLSGVVVHSGQAMGGHYYSYIRHRSQPDLSYKWYKYDDGDVSEYNLDDEEELKKECFGGEYTGEVFDHMLKRTSFKRQKRWWNAYILIYERIPESEMVEKTHDAKAELNQQLTQLSLSTDVEVRSRVPSNIDRIVRRQNLEFMHNRNQFCQEYFNFMKQLVIVNTPAVMTNSQNNQISPEIDGLAQETVKLASKFLFSVALHTKKTLRGPASEWYEQLSIYFKASRSVRVWFAEKVLLDHPHRFSEYLLECPNQEVRMIMSKIIALLAHLLLKDDIFIERPNLVLYQELNMELNREKYSISDHLLISVLSLLKREVADNGRNIVQYFNLFVMYSNLGPTERNQLLSLKVIPLFIQLALDEGPLPSIKYQSSDLSKLYSVVSMLVRCCDLSTRCQTSDGRLLSSNPYGIPHQPLQYHADVIDNLFKSRAFIKKIVEDHVQADDARMLLVYLCWENERFSADLLSELLWQITYCYTFEMQPCLQLLQNVLFIDDSWQMDRIVKSLIGTSEHDKETLFYIIQTSKSHYQKRAYQCIKMLTTLFASSPTAKQLLYTNASICDSWTIAVNWLNDEMEKRVYGSNQYSGYSNWSSPQSNETANGYFLERTASAKMTLRRAMELLPEEEVVEGSDSADEQTLNSTTDFSALSIEDETSSPPADKTSTNGPEPKKPITNQPVTSQPTTNQSATNKPAIDPPTTNQPPVETEENK